jgi:hypothetical protein
MFRTSYALFALGLSLAPSALLAEKKEETVADMIPGWVNRKLLTKEQAAALKNAPYLSTVCTSDKQSSCRPVFDYAHDCGVEISLEEIDEVAAKKERSPLINQLAILGERVSGFPTTLKGFGKWDSAMEKRWTALKQTYDTGVAIANKNISSVDRLREAIPIIEEAQRISEEMVRATGHEPQTGCGAPPEDSQKVDFVIAEKPKSAVLIAQMDFDACKRILSDPYDTTKCEAWQTIKLRNNELSGNYRYRVTWTDGSITERPFRAMSTGRKRVEIAK